MTSPTVHYDHVIPVGLKSSVTWKFFQVSHSLPAWLLGPWTVSQLVGVSQMWYLQTWPHGEEEGQRSQFIQLSRFTWEEICSMGKNPRKSSLEKVTLRSHCSQLCSDGLQAIRKSIQWWQKQIKTITEPHDSMHLLAKAREGGYVWLKK